MRAHSLEKRKRAIDRIMAGEDRQQVSREMGIPYMTLCAWVRERKLAQTVAKERAALASEPYQEETELPVEDPTDASREERDYALAILSELEVEISPEMLRILLNAAKRVLLKGGLHDT